MTSKRGVSSDLRGVQLPRICSLPPAVSSAGVEAVELAAMAGLILDPWQEYVLSNSLGERPDGKWAAFEVGLVVSRQNGKGSLLEARELAGLFLLGERFIVHSAHEFATSLEAFRRLKDLIEGTPELSKRVSRISQSHGEEGIELKSGQRIRFRTRTKRGGRGFTADLIILDEAMKIPESAHSALLPTLSARPNPQVWYTGSAVDQQFEEHGVVLARVRERGIAGNDPSLAYFEWSADADINTLTPDAAMDPALWAEANPALGIRISQEHIANEFGSMMGGRGFWVERLGVGDWPSTDAAGSTILDPVLWSGCIDSHSRPEDPVVFAFDITPDRARASIAVAGYRADGNPHVELVANRTGLRWLPDRLAELAKDHGVREFHCDAYGAAESLIPEIESRNLDVAALSSKETAQACGVFYDAVSESRLRHRGQPELTAAVIGASTRDIGGAWAWDRKSSAVDISPLMACTLALWALETTETRVPEVWDLNEIVARLQAEQAAAN
jgi:hypothetical protein